MHFMILIPELFFGHKDVQFFFELKLDDHASPENKKKSKLVRTKILRIGPGGLLLGKFRRITRPRFAIRKIFDNRVIIRVEYYVESGVTTRLD